MPEYSKWLSFSYVAPEVEHKGAPGGGRWAFIHWSKHNSIYWGDHHTREQKRHSFKCMFLQDYWRSHWLPQTWTPRHSVHSYIPLGVILLCYIFIYLSHCTWAVEAFSVSLLRKCVCDSTSSVLIQHSEQHRRIHSNPRYLPVASHMFNKVLV